MIQYKGKPRGNYLLKSLLVVFKKRFDLCGVTRNRPFNLKNLFCNRQVFYLV